MASLRRSLKGETVAEVIVASVIFLLVFAMGLTVMVEASATVPAGCEDVEADLSVREALYVGTDGLREGTSVREFGWGRLETAVAPYGSFENLLKLTVTARFRDGRRTVVINRIVETEYEEP